MRDSIGQAILKPPSEGRLPRSTGIFGWQSACFGKPGKRAKAAPTGFFLDESIAVVEEAEVATKLVDEEARDERFIRRIEGGSGAHHLRDDSTAVDVTRQYDRHLRGASEAHIGNVPLAAG